MGDATRHDHDHDGKPLTGSELATAALPLAQWISDTLPPSSLPSETLPNFDADELPTIETPGEVYVGGRQADGTTPPLKRNRAKEADELCVPMLKR